MIKKSEIQALFDNVEPGKKQFALDTVDEYFYFLEQLEALKKYPDIQVSKTNPFKQRITPAAKLKKELSNVIDAKRKTLLMILYRVENSAADELLSKLADFET